MSKKTIYKRPNGDFCCKKIIYLQDNNSTTRKRIFVKIDIENNPIKGTIFLYEGVLYKVRKILLLTSEDIPIKRKRVFKTTSRGYHMRVRLVQDGKYVKKFIDMTDITKLSETQVFEHLGVQYQVKVIVNY